MYYFTQHKISLKVRRSKSFIKYYESSYKEKHRHSSPWDTKLFEDALRALPQQTSLSLFLSLSFLLRKPPISMGCT